MIGERLAELRKDLHLTQQDLAEKLGLAASTISSYEIGNSSPDDETKIKLARLFDVSLDYLVGAIDDEVPLNRINRIDLPKDFPADAIPKVKEYIRLLMLDRPSG